MEPFHASIGEWLVSATAIFGGLVGIGIIWVSAKLTKVTAMVAQAEMAMVATHANDDMAEVAMAAIDAAADASHRPEQS